MIKKLILQKKKKQNFKQTIGKEKLSDKEKSY
jgi:hypothetical protein